MKKVFACIFSVFICTQAMAQQDGALSATMDKVKLDFKLDNSGRPFYNLSYNGKSVINPSRLGIKILDNAALDSNFEVTGTEKKSVDESWKPVWGEVSSIRNHYEQLTIHLKQKNAPVGLWILFSKYLPMALALGMSSRNSPT